MTINNGILDKAHVYTDISAVQSLNNLSGDEAQKVEAVAKQFESLMMNLMLKSMRQANDVFSQGNPLNTNSMRFYQDLLDQQLSLTVTRHGGVGLTEMLVRQLSQYQTSDVTKTMSNIGSLNRQPAEGMALNTQFIEAEQKTGDSLKPEVSQLENFVPLQSLSFSFGSEEQVDESIPLSEEESQVLNQIDSLLDKLFVSPESTESSLDVTAATAKQAYTESNEIDTGDGVSHSANPVTGPLVFSGPEEFIRTLYPAAQSVANELKVDPKLIMAQAALETGWGKHMIKQEGQAPSYNLFGIKADKRWSGDVVRVTTSEYRNGVKVKEDAPFRAYSNYNESFRDYLRFLQDQPRYQSAITNSAEPEAYAKSLQEAGYATDPQYAEKILRIYHQMDFQFPKNQLEKPNLSDQDSLKDLSLDQPADVTAHLPSMTQLSSVRVEQD